MYAISKWAGRHPWFVRLLALPILLYLQGRLAFIGGANLFFDGYTAPESLFWMLAGAIWLATYLYPDNARALLKTRYWSVKRLELISCLAGAGLWLFIGNQAASEAVGPPEPPRQASRLIGASMGLSRTKNVDAEPVKTDAKDNNRFRRAYRTYIRGEIKRLKAKYIAKEEAPGVSIAAGVLLLGFAALFLSCGIYGSGSSGTVAFIAGGIGLFALGIVFLISGYRRQAAERRASRQSE